MTSTAISRLTVTATNASASPSLSKSDTWPRGGVYHGRKIETDLLARTDPYLPYILLALFFLVSMAARPVLPTAETRYLTAAWEMLLNRSFLVPTLNFEPYFHKPPLLFWLIDMAWGAFGVGRTPAMLVVFLISSLTIYLTGQLARAMFPGVDGMAPRIAWITTGSAVFVIYSSLIYFDLLLTVTIVAFMLALLAFARWRGRRYAALAGLLLGAGILAKGPVMLVHVVWPVVLYPLWRDPERDIAPKAFYQGSLLLLACGIVPVLVWLGPALAQMDRDFAYNLVWNQSAGRVSGSLEGAHPRPFYYYLEFLPVMFVPWMLSPEFWRARPLSRVAALRSDMPQDYRMLRLLGLWALGVLVTFSLISGKQPHYIVPEFALVSIGFAYLMAGASLARLRLAVVIMFVVFGIGQVIASKTLLYRFDLQPLADFVMDKQDAPLAFAGGYQGELNYLARLKRPIEVLREADATSWLSAHPDGYLVTQVEEIGNTPGHIVYSQPSEKGYYVILAGG